MRSALLWKDYDTNMTDSNLIQWSFQLYEICLALKGLRHPRSLWLRMRYFFMRSVLLWKDYDSPVQGLPFSSLSTLWDLPCFERITTLGCLTLVGNQTLQLYEICLALKGLRHRFRSIDRFCCRSRSLLYEICLALKGLRRKNFYQGGILLQLAFMRSALLWKDYDAMRIVLRHILTQALPLWDLPCFERITTKVTVEDNILVQFLYFMRSALLWKDYDFCESRYDSKATCY